MKTNIKHMSQYEWLLLIILSIVWSWGPGNEQGVKPEGKPLALIERVWK